MQIERPMYAQSVQVFRSVRHPATLAEWIDAREQRCSQCKKVYHNLKPETSLYTRAIGQACDPSHSFVDFLLHAIRQSILRAAFN